MGYHRRPVVRRTHQRIHHRCPHCIDLIRPSNRARCHHRCQMCRRHLSCKRRHHHTWCHPKQVGARTRRWPRRKRRCCTDRLPRNNHGVLFGRRLRGTRCPRCRISRHRKRYRQGGSARGSLLPFHHTHLPSTPNQTRSSPGLLLRHRLPVHRSRRRCRSSHRHRGSRDLRRCPHRSRCRHRRSSLKRGGYRCTLTRIRRRTLRCQPDRRRCPRSILVSRLPRTLCNPR
jgi:hypothetical protein